MKRKIDSLLSLLLVAVLLFSLASCSASLNKSEMGGDNMSPSGNNVIVGVTYPENAPSDSTPDKSEDEDEGGNKFVENPFINTETSNVSTLSADVDTASYTYFRKLVNNGYSWQELSRYSSNFRTEEFLNYFKYTAEQPSENELFSVNSMLLPCPWNEENVLFTMTLDRKSVV